MKRFCFSAIVLLLLSAGSGSIIQPISRAGQSGSHAQENPAGGQDRTYLNQLFDYQLRYPASYSLRENQNALAPQPISSVVLNGYTSKHQPQIITINVAPQKSGESADNYYQSVRNLSNCQTTQPIISAANQFAARSVRLDCPPNDSSGLAQNVHGSDIITVYRHGYVYRIVLFQYDPELADRILGNFTFLK